MKKLLANMDLDGDSRVDYTEFLAASLNLHKLNQDDVRVNPERGLRSEAGGQARTALKLR